MILFILILIGTIFYHLTIQFRSAVTTDDSTDDVSGNKIGNDNINSIGIVNNDSRRRPNDNNNNKRKKHVTVAVQALLNIDSSPSATAMQTSRYVIIIIVIFFINLIFVFFVNWSYTFILFEDSSTTAEKGLVRLYVAVVMIIWNRVLLPKLLSILRFVGPIDSIRKLSRQIFGSSLAFPAVLFVYNNVIAPFIAVVVTDPNCLRNVFYSAKEV